jgi:indolepyruvate ferredoxin oxidoreductase beta subunit
MPEAKSQRPLTIAISALGGQGGAVLSDWIVRAAEASGYIAQATSVPGVAQRTGTTIYYLELFPALALRAANTGPVLNLMPAPGDVDVVMASELMEAGRAILRGFVTPDRTTLVTSTHRVFGITEKSAMGDGIADPERVMSAAQTRARRLCAFDMDAAAKQAGGAINAVMFGALAASGALPLPREAFEQAIRGARVAVEASLSAFDAGFASADRAPVLPDDEAAPIRATTEAGRRLSARIGANFPVVLHETLRFGCAKLMDYQDEAYAGLYLDRVGEVMRLEAQLGDPRCSYLMTSETARYLALWMAYEDAVRVADLKTRSARFEKMREEVRAEPGQIVQVSEFMHPRLQEVCEILPAGLGRAILGSTALSGLFGRFFGKGRRVRTTSVGAFLMLSFLAALRPARRGSLRYGVEQARIEAWLKAVRETAPADYDLAVEVAACARLIKGYGDTHARGLRNFEALMARRAALQGRPAGAAVMANLIKAALADEEGRALARALEDLDGRPALAAE